jgi:Sulfotransferase domain
VIMISAVPKPLTEVRTLLRPRRRLRLATRHVRILPSFIIIGAQRAGTSSLFDALRRHPDVVGPTAGEHHVLIRKEIHFFDSRFHRGVNWYRSFFPTFASRRLARMRGGDLVAGESSPYYLFHPAVPARVAASLPDVRLIALLRNPVDRAYSHYQLMRRKGGERFSFEEALAEEEKRLAGKVELILANPKFRSREHRRHAYTARGLYAEQLERWLAHFPRERLFVIRSEDLFAEPGRVYAEVLDFLDLRPWPLGELTSRNSASYPPLDPALRARLEERFAEPNARLARLLGRDFAWGPVPAPAGRAQAAAGGRSA